MLTLGPVAFAAPWALLALGLLPALWWLLRVTPPAPNRIAFPPVRLLAALRSTEETTASTPPWLVLLRLALALAIVLAAASPLINAAAGLGGSGPVILVVDNGWAAARDWPAREQALRDLVGRAERDRRPVVVVPTAATAEPRPPVEVLSAAEARERALALAPTPWPTDRAAALAALAAGDGEGVRTGAVAWLSDGLEEPGVRFDDLVERLGARGPVTVYAPEADAAVVVLRPPVAEAEAMVIAAVRAGGAAGREVWVRAVADDGALLARERLAFAAGETAAEARVALPAELRNRLARFSLEDEATAAAQVLVDERWRRRPVGLVGDDGFVSQPLLDELYYLENAVSPFAEVRRGGIAELLARDLAVLVLADAARLDAAERGALAGWIADGGVLVRFAGPALARDPATRDGDALLPVRLRLGDRAMGGALSWRRPAALAPFDEASPFRGLDASEDIVVNRQVLAEPSLDLAARTWARLDDGTPLVTAEARGDGWLVLFHTTANTTWSNLPLSGLFVEMLRRIAALSGGAVAGAAGPPLAPVQTLDGFGRLGPPPADAVSIPAAAFVDTVAGPRHPPGLYGAGDVRRALNLSASVADPVPIGPLPTGVERAGYGARPELDLRPWLFGLAMALALVDLAASLALRGLLRVPLGRRGPIAGAAVAAAVLAPAPAAAQTVVTDGTAVDASLTTRLAYVRTGDPAVDEVSRAGLAGVAMIVNRRTAVDLGEPVGVDPETDELVFFPLLYWPLVGDAPRLAPAAAARLDAYLQNGGTILFDTLSLGGGQRPAGLARLAESIDIPALIPIPRDHVLGRAYYLLDAFPGRWVGGTVWVERSGERINDGVTSVVVGGHDWAGAWAIDELQRPMFPVVPDGEDQREMAYRFGVNLVMHVLTGSYKSDQVHLKAILERLGR